MTHDSEIVTARLRFRRFRDEDAPALAEIIGSPDVARSIMVNVSSPALCLSRAKARVAWHNCWEAQGFGIWAFYQVLMTIPMSHCHQDLV